MWVAVIPAAPHLQCGALTPTTLQFQCAATLPQQNKPPLKFPLNILLKNNEMKGLKRKWEWGIFEGGIRYISKLWLTNFRAIFKIVSNFYYIWV